MTAWILEAGFYALLASGVLALTWSRPLTRLAAIGLLGFTLISSVTFFLGMPLEWKLVREISLVTWLATGFWLLYMIGDTHQAYRIALAACACDVAFCGALFLHGSMSANVHWLFAVVVNINFGVLCLCIAWPALEERYARGIDVGDGVRGLDNQAAHIDAPRRDLD
jgi:hypothetical protein